MRHPVTERLALDLEDDSPTRIFATGAAGRLVQMACPRCGLGYYYIAPDQRTAANIAKSWSYRRRSSRAARGGAPYECDCIRAGRPALVRA